MTSEGLACEVEVSRQYSFSVQRSLSARVARACSRVTGVVRIPWQRGRKVRWDLDAAATQFKSSRWGRINDNALLHR